MGLFNSILAEETPQLIYEPTTIQEAYMAVFYAILYADGEWSEREAKALRPILLRLRVFEDENDYYYLKKVETEYLIYGPQALINGGLQMIQHKYKPQLFCLCAELILADGAIKEEEEKVLEYLARAANISDEFARKVVEVTLIRMMN